MSRILAALLILLLGLTPVPPADAQPTAPAPEAPSATAPDAPTEADPDDATDPDTADTDADDSEDEDDDEAVTPFGSDTAAEGWSITPPLTTLCHTPVEVSGGFALNPFFMPAIQTKLGVRFPWEAFSWGLTAGYGYGPISMVFPGQEPLPQHVSLGFQWYVLDLEFAQLYTHLTGGYLFQTAHRSDGATVPLAGLPTVMTGVGLAIGSPVSLGWLPPSALTIGVDLGFPFIIRPEVSLRVAI